MAQRHHGPITSLGLLILRLGIGGLMVTHGLGKLEMLRAGNYAGFGDPIGLGSELSLILATGAEFFCAILVMIGLATRVAALPIVFTMGVAAFVVHTNDPWLMGEAFKLFMEKKTQMPLSKEPALVYMVPFAALIFTGPGKFSLDGLIWHWWCESRGGPEYAQQ